jgi:selenocysteine lyase/cysteine desulfurase
VVLDAVIDHLHLEASTGGYEAAALAEDRLDHIYDAVGELLHCGPHEVAIVDSATRAWAAAFAAFRFKSGDRILVSRAEYASNVLPILQVAERDGVALEVVPDDESGQLDIEALAAMLDERVALVAVTLVPTQGGLVNPAADIGRLTRAAGVPFLLDACQAAGQLPLDVCELGCDVLSATGRKFLRGPRGTGFLYVREELLDRLVPPVLDLHGATWTAPGRYEVRPDARRFEYFERSMAIQLGLAAAIDYALSWGIDAIEARLVAMAEELRRRLQELPGVDVHDQGRRRCAIVTFTVAGVPAQQVAERLRLDGVNVAVSSASSARFDLPARGLDTLVRASVHYYNSEEEVDCLVDLVSAIARRAAP